MRCPLRLPPACKLTLAVALAGYATVVWSQSVPHDNSKNAGANRGKQTFSSSCAQCHGLDGKGSERAPNIVDRPSIQRSSDSQIFHIIENGVPGTGMPAFHSLEPSQIRAVVAYLRMLQGKNKAAALPGNPEQGKALFFGKAGCSQCHMVSGEGGFIASDLSEYARVHQVEQIRNAIVDPASTGREVRLITVTLHSGEQYTGRVRDEDNFSLQLQSLDGTFHFLAKSEIDRMQFDSQSLMHSGYGSRLDVHEVNDLISYLMKVAGTTESTPPKAEEWEQ